MNREPIYIYKIGAILTPQISLNWANSLRKVTSVKHRSTLLRVAHGEIYTGMKLHSFGLKDSPNCCNCDRLETLQHKIFECPYAEKIWDTAFNLTNRLITSSAQDPLDLRENRVLGATLGTNRLVLTVHAEILLRLLAIKSTDTYRVRPINFVKNAVRSLIKNERKVADKESLEDLLR
jgi:hypothetical protein